MGKVVKLKGTRGFAQFDPETNRFHEAEKPKRIMRIQTVYYFGRQVVKKNRASNPLRAVSRCVEHLRLNSYEATVAEVFDSTGRGTLHAVVRRSINGNIAIVYQRDVQPSEVK